MDTKISVIIPAFNEQDNIDPLYREIKGVLENIAQSYEILLIDDGSTDTTLQRMKTLRQNDASVKIIKFRKNFGQSAALQAGFDYSSGAIVITLDADLQNDPHDIPTMIGKLENEDYDVLCGWRQNRQDSISKRLFSYLANSLRKIITSEIIHDSGCTLRAYRGECVKDLELYGELHRYIPVILQWKGYRIGELPVTHRKRTSGTTKYSASRLIKGFLDLIVVSFWQKYSARPMHIFGGSGLIMGFIGIVITGFLIIEKILFGTGIGDRPLFLMGILLIIVGVQFVAIGLLADIMLKVYYGQKTRKIYLIHKVFD